MKETKESGPPSPRSPLRVRSTCSHARAFSPGSTRRGHIAPCGSPDPPAQGKTTLASSYIQERKLPALWYQLDEGDGDIASFFHYLGLSVKAAAPRYRKPLPPLTPEYLPGY